MLYYTGNRFPRLVNGVSTALVQKIDSLGTLPGKPVHDVSLFWSFLCVSQKMLIKNINEDYYGLQRKKIAL